MPRATTSADTPWQSVCLSRSPLVGWRVKTRQGACFPTLTDAKASYQRVRGAVERYAILAQSGAIPRDVLS
eukprot:4633607-Lingulodinium_polyedra.AAC.1